MPEFIARIEWDAIDISSGLTESGLLLLRPEDVVIVRHDIIKATKLIGERLGSLGREPSADDFQKINAEIEMDPTSKDVVGFLCSKSVQVSDSYHFYHADFGGREELLGFGLAAGVGDIPNADGCRLTFSWDWFNVEQSSPDPDTSGKVSGKAKKLQEAGEISFERTETSCGPEVTRMFFDTDVSLRISRRGHDPLKPDWRLNLHRGSEIFWPSLINGQIQANGFVQTTD